MENMFQCKINVDLMKLFAFICQFEFSSADQSLTKLTFDKLQSLLNETKRKIPKLKLMESRYIISLPYIHVVALFTDTTPNICI